MRGWGLVLLFVVGCGSPAVVTGDAGTDAPSGCATACDDGLFCNGVETCVASACVDGTVPCPASMACDEVANACTGTCIDGDGDGAHASSCGGTDCDDTNPDVHPRATEVCDAANLDEDCDPTTIGAADLDGDMFIASRCCNGTNCGGDCDDAHAAIRPGATEACNLFDDDCDLAIDEGVQAPFYPDCDGDHDGAMGSTPMLACAMPVSAPSGCMAGETHAGWSSYGTDCADHNASRSRTQPEVPGDLVDNNCDGRTDEQFELAGGIGSLGGGVAGSTLRIVGSLEVTRQTCGPTYCVQGGITP